MDEEEKKITSELKAQEKKSKKELLLLLLFLLGSSKPQAYKLEKLRTKIATLPSVGANVFEQDSKTLSVTNLPKIASNLLVLAQAKALATTSKVDLVKAVIPRVEVITSTEIFSGYNNAVVLNLPKESLVRYSAMLDACPRCLPLNGNIYKISEAPSLPQHPRCKCVYVPL